MPNLASVLKNEICRLARKEVKSQVGVMKRAGAQHRRDIAELKRLVQDLSRRLTFLESQERKRISTHQPKSPPAGTRFSPRWVKAQRQRLGLSAADYGKLVGVSALTVYNWERGKAKPRKAPLAALAAMRDLKKREALKRLEMLGS